MPKQPRIHDNNNNKNKNKKAASKKQTQEKRSLTAETKSKVNEKNRVKRERPGRNVDTDDVESDQDVFSDDYEEDTSKLKVRGKFAFDRNKRISGHVGRSEQEHLGHVGRCARYNHGGQFKGYLFLRLVELLRSLRFSCIEGIVPNWIQSPLLPTTYVVRGQVMFSDVSALLVTRGGKGYPDQVTYPCTGPDPTRSGLAW